MAGGFQFLAPGVYDESLEGLGNPGPGGTGGSGPIPAAELVRANALAVGRALAAAAVPGIPDGGGNPAGLPPGFLSDAVGYPDPTIDGIPIAEPQRAYDFRVILPAIAGAPLAPIAEVADLTPIEGTTAIQEYVGGRHQKYAGNYDSPDLTLVLYHNQASDGVTGHIALEYLRAWKALVQNLDGTYNYPIQYLFPIIATFRNVDQNIGYAIGYYNCFPLSASPIKVQFAQNMRTVVIATFSVERTFSAFDAGAVAALASTFSSGGNAAGAIVAPTPVAPAGTPLLVV